MKLLVKLVAFLFAAPGWAQTAGCGGTDVNTDGVVNVSDLLMLLAGFGSAAPDTNGDGVVNVSDLLKLLAAFGDECATGGIFVTLTTDYCSPMSTVVMADGRAGDCIVNQDQSVDSSSTLGGCGGHGADDGYCEVQGNKVRACFHDRCWAEDAMQCSDYSDTSATIDLWMNVQCDIGPFDAGPEDSWTTFQTFGPSSITDIGGLREAGWELDSINDWGSCNGATPGPVSRCACACNSRGVGEYAGFWCGGACTGTQDLPLPDGYDMVALTFGMHYDNPVCRGSISLGHTGDNQANGRPAFHQLFDNLHYAEKQTVTFTYAPGDVMRLVEYETCIIHLYNIKVKASPGAGLPASLIGYWPLDGDATDSGPNRLDGETISPEWVTGINGLAFYFNGDDAIQVTEGDAFDVAKVLMVAWIMPTLRDVARDRGIVMNKESAYEFGLQDNVGALQGAFGPGCWRWWGSDIIPLDTWTQVGVGVDGTNEKHFVNGAFSEQDGCPGSLTVNDNHFRIGARTDLWDGAGNDGHASQFRGSIDEAMLFGDMLTDAQVIDVYDATSVDLAAAAIDMSALPDGLIAYWPLDGDGTDVSGNGLDGVPSNAEWVTGAYGLAFHFSGDDTLLIEESGDTILDATNVMMVGWIMPTIRDVAADRGIVMNKESSYEFGLEDNTGALQGAFGPGCWRWWGTSIVPLNEWTHVGVGVDGTNEVHYVNGDFIEQDGCGGSLTKNDENFKIGARGGNGAHGSQFKGAIDEGMLFDSGLSPGEVSAIYTAFVGGEGLATVGELPASLVGYWPLDGDGNDISGNGLDCQDLNGEWVAGLSGLAFFFNGDDALVADENDLFDVSNVLMVAWIMPTLRDVDRDRGIVMNKESAYEFGLQDNVGALQGAFNPGCWRWWGGDIIPLNEWTQVGVGVDGTNEMHYVNGAFTEQDGCAGSCPANDNHFRIGARTDLWGGQGNDGHASQFLGSIDEVMLFGTMLSAADITSVYDATSAALPAEANIALSDLPGGLVGYWPLDGDGVDVSGNGLDGDLVNAEFVTGIFGLAFHFSGDDSVVVPESGDTKFDVTSCMMVTWIMPSQLDVAADRGIVMNKESSYEFGLMDNTGQLQGAFGPGCWRWWGNDVIAINEWTHVGVGVDGTNEKHYVNGAFSEQDGCAGSLTINDEDFKIGARGGNGAHGSQFRGAIDEAMLFDSALDDAKMRAVYDAANPNVAVLG